MRKKIFSFAKRFFMIKALFFDIDGTLVSFSTHEIPSSAIEAVKAAKAKGVKIFISTGRPKAFLTSNLDPIRPLVDGYITNNGALVEVGEEVVVNHHISADDVKKLLLDAHQHDYPMILMSRNDFAVFNRKPVVEKVFNVGLHIPVDVNMIEVEDIVKQDIMQVTSFFNFQHEQIFMPKIKTCVAGRWSPEFVDITSVNADKGKGLASVANHLGIDIKETMAFGDGGNDVPIIQKAGIGVAMGNSMPGVQHHADFVTSSVDSDGILLALKHFNVI